MQRHQRHLFHKRLSEYYPRGGNLKKAFDQFQAGLPSSGSKRAQLHRSRRSYVPNDQRFANHCGLPDAAAADAGIAVRMQTPVKQLETAERGWTVNYEAFGVSWLLQAGSTAKGLIGSVLSDIALLNLFLRLFTFNILANSITELMESLSTPPLPGCKGLVSRRVPS